jgi:hypothetical protein
MSPSPNSAVWSMRPVRRPSAERAERDQADAEFLQDCDDLLLGPAPEQRVFTLQRGDRVRRMRPANSVRADLGQAEMHCLAPATSSPTVPAAPSIGTCGSTRCWYSRSIRSVPSRHSDPSTACRMCSGRLDIPVCRPSASNAKPDLVAMTTWSRTGASASPTSSSLTTGP